MSEDYFERAPEFTEAILGAIHPDGTVDDAAYAAAVVEMGATGYTGAALINWAQLLASTHRAGIDALAFHLPSITDQRMRALAHKRGCELVELARRAVGDEAGDQLLIDYVQQVQTVMGNDVWWLIWVMAAATAPVLRTLGGLDQFAQVGELVVTYTHELSPVVALAAVTAGLSAIAAGHPVPARSYLEACTAQQLLGVLLPIAIVVLPGPTTVLSVDDRGLPDGIGDPGEHTITLLSDLLDALAGDDRQHVAAATAAVSTATDEEQILVGWALALAVGQRVGQHLATIRSEQ